jgi:hypothetical protein
MAEAAAQVTRRHSLPAPASRPAARLPTTPRPWDHPKRLSPAASCQVAMQPPRQQRCSCGAPAAAPCTRSRSLVCPLPAVKQHPSRPTHGVRRRRLRQIWRPRPRPGHRQSWTGTRGDRHAGVVGPTADSGRGSALHCSSSRRCEPLMHCARCMRRRRLGWVRRKEVAGGLTPHAVDGWAGARSWAGARAREALTACDR